MSSNYPDGVTGNEYQIAGPDHVYTETRNVYCKVEGCKMFEINQDVEMDLECYRGTEWGAWTCSSCGYTNDYEAYIDDEQEEDPDDARDRMTSDW